MGVQLLFAAVPGYGWYVQYPMIQALSLTVLWGISAVWVSAYFRGMPTGTLRWDGKLWYWSADSEPLQAVSLLYDFQSSVCIVLQPTRGAKFWLWLDEDVSCMPQWRSIRRALLNGGAAA